MVVTKLPWAARRYGMGALLLVAHAGLTACAVSFDGYYQAPAKRGAGGSGSTTTSSTSGSTSTTTDTTTTSTTDTTTSTTATGCDAKATCQDCYDCASYAACASEWTACANAAYGDCVTYLNCTIACAADDTTCFATCEALYPDGQAPAYAWSHCIYCTGCHATCDGATNCK